MSKYSRVQKMNGELAKRIIVTMTLCVTSILGTSCGGGGSYVGSANPAAGTPRVGTGSLPAYDALTNMLSLPLVQIDSSVLPNVKLRLEQNGTWAVLSSGTLRPSTGADTPGAMLAAPGRKNDLSGAQTDTTLTITRLHAGTRVFSNVALRLTGKTWSLVAIPEEVKTLKLEDFAASAVMTADESHHVILKSGPLTGVQNVPMHLSSRNYRFCMDAQAEGADSTTMLDSTGRTVFTLKAGEPCVTMKATNGAYTLQHRYGGSGSTRTVFLRNRTNTATAAASAATLSAARKPALRAGVLQATSRLASAGSAGADDYPGDEYWSVRRAGDDGQLNFLGVVGRSNNAFPGKGPVFCADPPAFGFQNLWLANTFMAIRKDAFGAPLQLGAPLACTTKPVIDNAGVHGLVTAYLTDYRLSDGSSGMSGNIVAGYFQPLTADVSAANYQDIQSNYIVNFNIGGWTPGPPPPVGLGSSPDGRAFPAYLISPVPWVTQTLQIVNWAAGQFELASNGQRVVQVIPANSGSYAFESNNQLTLASSAADPNQPAVVLQPTYRYFPAGLPPNVSVGVGEVALFTGPNCTGAAVISAADKIPYLGNIPTALGVPDVSATNTNGIPLFEPTFLPDLAKIGTSFQLGLQTSALVYEQSSYRGKPQTFDQLTCSNATSVSANGLPGSMTISVDTIEMVVSTDACEYCNLAGVDFTGDDLSNVRLGHANLNGATLSNANLSNADMRSVTLQSANLLHANLEGANLCSAQLNGSVAVPKAATLTGAHLKNANLAGANLDGVKFSSASFYSATPGSCQQDRCGDVPSTCAGAYGASINNTNFDSAYLSNTDFGNVKGVAVNFSHSVLLGVSFKSANLSGDVKVGNASSFNNAMLQGSDFTNAVLSFADFTGAQFDPASSCVQALLPKAFGGFAASTVGSPIGSANCVKSQPTASFCVQSAFTASPSYPVTDCTNTCADGSGNKAGPQQGTCPAASGCTVASWNTTLGNSSNPVPTSSCVGASALCGNPFLGSTINHCW